MNRAHDKPVRTAHDAPWWLRNVVMRLLPLSLVAVGLVFSGYVFLTVRAHHIDIDASVEAQNRTAMDAAVEHFENHFKYLRTDLQRFGVLDDPREAVALIDRHAEYGMLDVLLTLPGGHHSDVAQVLSCAKRRVDLPHRLELGRHLAYLEDNPQLTSFFPGREVPFDDGPSLLYSIPVRDDSTSFALLTAVLGVGHTARVLELGNYANMTAVVDVDGGLLTCEDYPDTLRDAVVRQLGDDPVAYCAAAPPRLEIAGWQTLMRPVDLEDGRARWMIFHYDLAAYQYNHGWSGPLDAFGPALGMLLICLLGAVASYFILRRERERYEHLRDRWWASHVLTETLQGTADSTGTAFFRALTCALANTLKVKYCLVGELTADGSGVRTLAVWAGDRHVDNFTYGLAGTPCEEVAAKSVCLHPDGVQELFPDGHLLKELGVRSYHGTPLLGTDGRALGLLMTLDEAPLDEDYRRLAHLLDLFAARAAAELQRQRAEEAQARQREELERRVRKRTRELDDARNLLVESEKMAALGGLVAGVAHEINTPVGVGVTAATHLVERSTNVARRLADGTMTRSDLDRFLAESVATGGLIYSNLHRAAELINSFKLVAVDQTSEVQRTFNLKAYFEEVLNSLGSQLLAGGHAVELDCPDDLVIYTYPGLIARIMTSLIMNSLRHAYEGRQGGHILIRARFNEDRILVNYRDDGCGMNESVRSRVFEPFFTTKRGQHGSGLGMYVVYNLVTQTLKGQIHLESSPGRGVDIAMTFPVPRYALGGLAAPAEALLV